MSDADDPIRRAARAATNALDAAGLAAIGSGFGWEQRHAAMTAIIDAAVREELGDVAALRADLVEAVKLLRRWRVECRTLDLNKLWRENCAFLTRLERKS